MYIVRKMSCEAQAGKGTCAFETLTTDMFSEVIITNHKCHVSGIKEQIWQALLCSHVKELSPLKYTSNGRAGFLEQRSVMSAKYIFMPMYLFIYKP